MADKPHFLPVTPAGEYVEQTLLRRLIRRLDNPHLVPLHRIDRHTAGLVLFSANPASRSAYQSLFPTRQIDKYYEAIAPALPEGGQQHRDADRGGRAEWRPLALRPVSGDRQETPVARAHGGTGRGHLQ